MITATILWSALQSCTLAIPSVTPPLVMGHRGSGTSAEDKLVAENTLASMEKAFDDGADSVETDIQLSADGEVVIMHDFELDKTTTLSGCVSDYNYAQLATADATKGSGAIAKAGVPTLREILQLAKKRGKHVNIEMKVNDSAGACPKTDIAALAAAAISVVRDEDMDKAAMFSSFSFEILEEIKRKAPGIPVGYITAEAGEQLLLAADRSLKAGFEAIHPIYFGLTADEKTFKALRDKEIHLSPWTVNAKADMLNLAEGGVYALITNDVHTAVAVRNGPLTSRKPRGSCESPEATDELGCASSSADLSLIFLALGWILTRTLYRPNIRA